MERQGEATGMTLTVELRERLPAPVVDLSFDYRGASYGATLEGAQARAGHCASRLQLIDTAVRNPDGWFDVPLSDRQVEASTVAKAIAMILAEHFEDDLAAHHLRVMPIKETPCPFI